MRIRFRPAAIPRGTVRLLLWALATWLVLCLHEAPILGNHSICGPWGCGPTIPALLAAHGFWLMVAVPAGVGASRRVSPKAATRLGWAGLGIACLGIIVVVAMAQAERPHFAPPGTPTYAVERALFALATTVQIPLVPTALAALILLVGARRPTDQSSSVDASSSEAR